MKNFLVIDVETTISNDGDPFDPRNKLCYVGLRSPSEEHLFKIEYDEDPYGDKLIQIKNMIDQAEVLVGFNLKFDLHWIRRYIRDVDYTTKHTWDCQLVEFLLSSQRIRFPALDEVCSFYDLGRKLDTVATEYWDHGIDTTAVPSGLLELYLSTDLRLTEQLYLHQWGLIKGKSEQFKNLVWLHNEDTKVLQEMEFNGIKLDVDKIKEKESVVAKEMEEIDKRLVELLRFPSEVPVNLGSTAQLSAILYGGYIHYPSTRIKETVLKSGEVKQREVKCVGSYAVKGFTRPSAKSETALTKKLSDEELREAQGLAEREFAGIPYRKYSTDLGTLASLSIKSKTGQEFVSLLLKRSELDQRLTTYLRKLPEMIQQHYWEGNVIHGQFNQCVARTGRLSSSKPNLQNLDGELHDIFVPRNPLLINVDAKALEWVVCAHLARDRTALDEINRGIDQHTENQKALGLPPGKPGRLIAKIFVFRLIYGSVAQGFATDPDFSGTSTDVAFWEELIRKFYKKYPDIELFHRALVKEWKTTGRLTMPTGRTYIFEDTKDFNYLRPKILNYPVQGLGADLMAIARVSLYKRFMKANLKSLLVSTIHDSIVVDAVSEEKDVIIKMIQQTWDDIPHNYEYLFKDTWSLPSRCEISVGPNLKEMETV